MFDSWAILAWLQGEPAGMTVEALLAQSSRRPGLAGWSSINAGEVYYHLARRRGLELADAFWRDAVSARLPLRLYSVTEARVRRAAGLKARLPIAYADAFALALALELRQTLVTGDSEIRHSAAEAGITLHWLGEEGH